MSTSRKRRGHTLHLDLSNVNSEQLPPVVAVFLILFDVKAGYTIAWKRSTPGLDLVESVEFKSLPSGLHNVPEDIIYFVHDNDYAGISAFVNKPAAKSERNALMLAVGALVPLSQGRLGKSWKHAAGLKELARNLALDLSIVEPLEEFWKTHHDQDGTKSSDLEAQATSPSPDETIRKPKKPLVDGQSHLRHRAVSTASAFATPGQSLSPHHPALSLPAFLDTFGPLIFPLYKAALLRKRILLVGQAPVELACNFVFNISILSGIPTSISTLLPLEPLPVRLRPLFSVGVHDMQTLAQGSRNDRKVEDGDDDMGYGWVACSTDDILITKDHLYDTLVSIPPPYTAQAVEKVWPRISSKRNPEIKATQRDLRRYRTLRRELHLYHSRSSVTSPFETISRNTPNHTERHTPHLPENSQETFDDASSTSESRLTESPSWSALAYSSFMWWASAGEKRADLDEEAEHDSALLRDFGSPQTNGSPNRPRSSSRMAISRADGSGEEQADGMLEMAIIAYFHRLTILILRTLSTVVDAADDDDDDDASVASAGNEDEQESRAGAGNGSGAEAAARNRGVVLVTTEDMARMGLDIWSEADGAFVQELVEFYWGRRAEIQGGRVECCGVRIF